MNYISRLLPVVSLSSILSCVSLVIPEQVERTLTSTSHIPARDPTCPYEIFELEILGRYFTLVCSSTSTLDICAIEEREYENALRVHRERCR